MSHTEIENNPKILREKALKALELAKRQEAQSLKEGASYERVDSKTIKLKHNMPVTVEQLSDREVWVNKKMVTKDQNENWIAHEELTPSEEKAFKTHIGC